MIKFLERRVGAALTVAGLTVIILAIYIVLAQGASSFPPLSYLASELGVVRGTQLQKGVVYNGRPFFFYIVGAQEHANGRYTVELQAR